MNQEFIDSLTDEEKTKLIFLFEQIKERETCKKGKPCKGCPFNDGITEEATDAQNLGCLPSAYDILKILSDSGKHWACHGHSDLTCGGLIQHFSQKAIIIDTNVELHTEAGIHSPLGIPQ